VRVLLKVSADISEGALRAGIRSLGGPIEAVGGEAFSILMFN